MKNTSKIVAALAVVGVAAIVVTLAKKVKDRRMLTKIADEGYETAQDILFPNKYNNGGQLQYGPVLPAL
ncbi:hypothetical protein QWZ08_11810 [Ferruginibacter paludis]|uniref:hypothetical protein n=1 Tax=Ferruginibacter TaxID=1004303 RepID=UPI0025B52B0F|nr:MULTISPECIES: hypothetical protein [Ferruginibacter]MDN3656319.1 hypothetical protein [Ferruginibacter paludis]